LSVNTQKWYCCSLKK